MHVYVCMCMHVCMWIYTYIYTHWFVCKRLLYWDYSPVIYFKLQKTLKTLTSTWHQRRFFIQNNKGNEPFLISNWFLHWKWGMWSEQTLNILCDAKHQLISTSELGDHSLNLMKKACFQKGEMETIIALREDKILSPGCLWTKTVLHSLGIKFFAVWYSTPRASRSSVRINALVVLEKPQKVDVVGS